MLKAGPVSSSSQKHELHGTPEEQGQPTIGWHASFLLQPAAEAARLFKFINLLKLFMQALTFTFIIATCQFPNDSFPAFAVTCPHSQASGGC